jgi:hypothetical protein
MFALLSQLKQLLVLVVDMDEQYADAPDYCTLSILSTISQDVTFISNCSKTM